MGTRSQFRSNEPADSALDTDNDGVSNADEYLAGTDPLDRETYLYLYSIQVAGSPQTPLLGFVAFAGKTYSVLRGRCVNGGAWMPIADLPATSTNRVIQVRDSTPLPPGQTEIFYRLVTPRLPP